MTSALQNLEPAQQDTVRTQVHALLKKTKAYDELDPVSQRNLAKGMVEVVAYLSDPNAGQKKLAEGQNQLARGLEEKSAVEKFKERQAEKPGFAGKDFDAGALRAGTQAFKDMVGAVDFPKFVSGLIEGVFTSIVDSSIRQMQAYQKLLEAVVMSVGEFASENLTNNQGRDYLASRFSDTLTVNVSGDTPRLALKDDAPEDGLAKIKAAMGLTDDPDVDDEESEAELARRATLEMAKLRQQQLATMVLLGINRIVVTDGLINAKVIFKMSASDVAARTNTASMYDDQFKYRQQRSGGGWFSSDYDRTQEGHRTVVSSVNEDQSESKANISANLTGEVRVNFKSETFPLDRMASVTELSSVNERAKK
jgi:hypothetical protein